MNRFDSLYESLLLEMPYIEIEQEGKKVRFDLELERYTKDLDGFKHLIDILLHNGEISDKYGNHLHLLTHEDRVEFARTLHDDPVVRLFLKKYHNTNILEILKELGHL